MEYSLPCIFWALAPFVQRVERWAESSSGFHSLGIGELVTELLVEWVYGALPTHQAE